MSLLNKATTGIQLRPQVTVIMGPNKVGKSFFASKFPSPLMVDLEGGSSHLNITRINREDIPTLKSFKDLLQEMLTGQHNYKTLIVDSAEALEGLIHDHILVEGKVDSIEKYEQGYGKGYTRAREIMRDIMHTLKDINQKRSMHINIVAHTQIKTFTDPHTNTSYDRHLMRANEKMASIIKDLADQILFATYKVYTTSDGNSKKSKAFGEGERVLFTEWRPAFDAGNRQGLPFELPLDYEAYSKSVLDNTGRKTNVLKEIERMSALVTDPKIKAGAEKALKEAGDDLEKLIQIQSRLHNVTSTPRSANA